MKIEDICTRICSGGTPKSGKAEYYENGTIPWLNTKEINFNRIQATETFITEEGLNNSSAKWIKPHAVIVAMYGATAGRVAVAEAPLTTNQACCNLEVDETIADYRYVYYWLKQNFDSIAGLANGGAQQNLSAKVIRQIEINLPDLIKQRSIANFLDSFDSKIETNAKLNGYLADAVDGLFEKALGQAEEKTLTDVVEILSGGTPKTKISEYWEDGEIPFFGPGDANGSTYCLTTAKRITQLGLENCNSELYPVDTVFLTARGTVGKVAMAGKPMAMNQSCFAFRGLGVSQPAVYQIIKRAVRSLKAKANGATFAAINTRDLKIETILVPSAEELTAFEEEAASLHSMMRVNEEESLKLSSLRDALLPKLIAGEIDVSKIDFMQLNSHLV